jgi:glycosyltransferase involved in cell wall biosynthesis
VAVVVPTFNRAGQLDDLLDAVAGQVDVEGGYEVVVVDGGSTDGTAEVVARHPGAHHLFQPNAGPAAARNRGWRATTAPVVAFTDDDTLPSPTWLHDLLAALDADAGLSAVGGAVRPVRRTRPAEFVELDGLVNHGVDADGTIRYLITANLAVRREALEAVGGFDESFPAASGEDTDLTWRLQAAGHRLATTDQAVVRHRHPERWADVLALFAKHGRSRRQLLRRHPGAGLGSSAERRRLDPRLRYRRYRGAGAGRFRAAGFLAFRYVGLAVMAWNARRG